jgi:hypothetical protein
LRTWLVRLWSYLRRLIVGDDEGGYQQGGSENEPLPDDEIAPEGSEPVGRELQDFFLELLQADNLKRFQGSGRNTYLNERRGGLSGEAWRALSEGDMKAIEAHIAAITGSRASLLYVVCPPM